MRSLSQGFKTISDHTAPGRVHTDAEPFILTPGLTALAHRRRCASRGRDGPRPSGHWTTSFPDTFEPERVCLLDVKASNLAVKVHQNGALPRLDLASSTWQQLGHLDFMGCFILDVGLQGFVLRRQSEPWVSPAAPASAAARVV